MQPSDERFRDGWIGEVNRLCEDAPDNVRFVMFVLTATPGDSELVTIANMQSRTLVRRFVDACLKRFLGDGSRHIQWTKGGKA